jgi:hypothetical protein
VGRPWEAHFALSGRKGERGTDGGDAETHASAVVGCATETGIRRPSRALPQEIHQGQTNNEELQRSREGAVMAWPLAAGFRFRDSSRGGAPTTVSGWEGRSGSWPR